MSCSKTFFNLRIKTLDKKGTSILNKACCGRFEILKTYISRSITHTVHIWKMILRISAYDLKKLMVLYNNITRDEFRQLYNYNTRGPNDIFALNIIIFLDFRYIYIGFIEPHNLLFLVAAKVSFWFFLSLNINDPHNILSLLDFYRCSLQRSANKTVLKELFEFSEPFQLNLERDT